MSKPPIITLTTDFGTQDGYVGAMKGRILTLCPEAHIVDITHEIEPQGILQASWSLVRSATHFPFGTIHVAVIDPGVGSDRSPVLLKTDDHWYIGPDNGVFTEIIRQSASQTFIELHRKTKWWGAHASFDGLSLFAPAAACLANGVPLVKMGSVIERLNLTPGLEPRIKKGAVKGRIIMFDRFGNAITNIRKADIDKLNRKELTITCDRHTLKLAGHYQQGGSGAIALINSDDLLEISVFRDSASDKLGLKAGDEVYVR